MLREMRTGITVLLSMLFSLFILMLGVDCYYLCENVRKDTINDTKYEYMYTLKYPEESVPEGGEACFVRNSLAITLMSPLWVWTATTSIMM